MVVSTDRAARDLRSALRNYATAHERAARRSRDPEVAEEHFRAAWMAKVASLESMQPEWSMSAPHLRDWMRYLFRNAPSD